MKKIPKKARLKEKDQIVIKIDPDKLRSGIVIPQVKYEVTATVEEKKVFDGMVIPIPRVLLYYLRRNELLILSTIIEETNEKGYCTMTVTELATRLKTSPPAISNALYMLRKSGLLSEAPNGKKGAGRTRKINYDTVQHLNDLVEGEDPGVYSRIRKSTRKVDINNMTKEDIREAYDNKVLEPDHDPIEEEEYD